MTKLSELRIPEKTSEVKNEEGTVYRLLGYPRRSHKRPDDEAQEGKTEKAKRGFGKGKES